MAKVQVYRHAVERKENGQTVINPKTKKPLMDSTYWTQTGGKGKQATSAISAGGGVYYATGWVGEDVDLLTDQDKAEIKATSWAFQMADTRRANGEIRKGKVHRTLDLMDAMIQTCNTHSNRKGRAWEKAQAIKTMGLLTKKLQELEAALMGGGAPQTVIEL